MLKYARLTEVEGPGNYEFVIQFDSHGAGIAFRRGDDAKWVAGQLRIMANILEKAGSAETSNEEPRE